MRVNDPGKRIRLIPLALLALLLCSLPFCPAPAMAGKKHLLDVWSEIKASPPVAIQPVHLDPKSSALLILDVEEWTCNAARRPPCQDSVVRIKGFLDQALAKGAWPWSTA